MFAPLPAGFALLQQATGRLGRFELVAPKQLEEIGLRMRRLYAQARDTGYQQLSKGAWRRLPYALWIDGHPPLEEVEPGLTQQYWGQMLPEALTHPRASKRWLSPLLYTYCHSFQRLQPGFVRFAASTRRALASAQGPMAQLLVDLQAQLHWFEPDRVGAALGAALVTPEKPISDVLAGMSLWPGFLEEPIASEAFAGALRSQSVTLTDESQILKLLQWSRVSVGGNGIDGLPRYPEHRVLLADAMLEPWANRMPPESIKGHLLNYFIRHYGDPRLIGNLAQSHHWQGVSPGAVATVKRWLVGDTLRAFMRILQLTADEIWRYRERFWMAYHTEGVIEEAWLVLGSQASWRARQEFRNAEWAKYGHLTGGASADQSMLFLRMGHIVFMEWSHNGSLRASRSDDPQTPAMYQRDYNGLELRAVQSMDFHNGALLNPQLVHANSEGGTWQRKARDFIANNIGVRLNDNAIIG